MLDLSSFLNCGSPISSLQVGDEVAFKLKYVYFRLISVVTEGLFLGLKFADLG